MSDPIEEVLRHLKDSQYVRGVSTAKTVAALEALAVLRGRLSQERVLREQIEDDHWPYEWQVATAEREKRKAAEADQQAEQHSESRDPGQEG